MTSTKARTDLAWEDANGLPAAHKIGQLRSLLSSIASATWTGPDLKSNAALSSRGNQIVAPAYMQRYQEAARQAARLWSMESVEQGWDGRDAESPSRDSLKAAHKLLDLISNNPMIPIPIASVNNTGQSNLFWEFDGFYADVDIDAGKIEFFVKSDADDEGNYYEEPLDSDLIPPTLLVALLQKAINAKTESLP